MCDFATGTGTAGHCQETSQSHLHVTKIQAQASGRPYRSQRGACLGSAVTGQAVAVCLRLLALLVPLLQGLLVLWVAPVHLGTSTQHTGVNNTLQPAKHAVVQAWLPTDRAPSLLVTAVQKTYQSLLLQEDTKYLNLNRAHQQLGGQAAGGTAAEAVPQRPLLLPPQRVLLFRPLLPLDHLSASNAVCTCVMVDCGVHNE